MTGPSSPVGFAPPERMAAIERRFSPTPSSASDSASFEALLMEAAARSGDASGTNAFGQLGGAGLGNLTGAGLNSLNLNGLNLNGLNTTGLSSLLPAGLGSAVPTTDSPLALSAVSAATPSPVGAAVVAAASKHLGVPYLWGGTDAHNGFDCSGLVQDAYRQVGVEMPKWSRHQATMGVEVDSIDQAAPGDVLTFGQPVSHVALYVGDGQMLHAPKTGEVVKIEAIDRPIASIRRIVSGQANPVTTAGVGGVGRVNPGEAERSYQPMFESAGAEWNVDPALLAAVASTESGFNPRATSPVGAQGLMQFMPATAAEMGVDPWDPASAIDGAARYLRKSLDQFGSTDLAVASYNAGRGAVARYGGVPPFSETQNYVQKVLAAREARS